MFKHPISLASFAVFVALASPAFSQQPATGWVKVGGLGCTMSPTIGLLVGSVQNVNCKYTPDGLYAPEIYTGTLGTVGIDVGVIGGGLLAWGVFMPGQGTPHGALAGTYVGASGDLGLGLGAGVNVLWGGNNRSVALQPISVEGSVSIDVTLGVSSLQLQWAP